MKQILQSYKTGELWLAKVPAPSGCGKGVVVRSVTSLISAGTEKMIVGMAKKSLLGKAKARPDLVKQVLKKIKSEGLTTTFGKVRSKLAEPITLGYSAAGVVVEAGANSRFQPGDRVAIAGAGYATHAEFNYVPDNLCARIPEGVSFEEAAFSTVGAIALQGVRQADPQLGEKVVVLGLGLLGLLTVQLLKANGCAVLAIDLDPGKVELALQLGADVAACGDGLKECVAFTGGHGADAVIITAATPSNVPVENAAEMSRHKGRVVIVGLVGMNIPRDEYYRKELDLRMSMSYGPGRYDSAYEEGGQDYPFSYVRFTEQRNLESFLYLVQQGKVTPSALVSFRFPLEDALDAYSLLESGPKNCVGILIDYPNTGEWSKEKSKTIACSPAAKMSKAGLGLGFLGAGGFANGVLLPALSKDKAVHFGGVCANSGKSAEQTASRHSFSYSTTDVDKVISDEAHSAIVVATRHGSHSELVCKSLLQGKHVFVEKPLCLNEEQLLDISNAIEESQGFEQPPFLMVGFNRRFSPHAIELKQFFANRQAPMVISYRINAGNIPRDHWIQDPQDGGGRIIGEVCHFVDFCSALVDSAVTSVVANSISSDRVDLVAHDSVVITIKYADGSLVTVQYLAEGNKDLPKERCEVFADGQSAVMDNFSTTTFFGGRKRFREKNSKGFKEELNAFVETCKKGGEWPIPWHSIVETHRVCFAAIDSLRTGAPVSIGHISAKQ